MLINVLYSLIIFHDLVHSINSSRERLNKFNFKNYGYTRNSYYLPVIPHVMNVKTDITHFRHMGIFSNPNGSIGITGLGFRTAIPNIRQKRDVIRVSLGSTIIAENRTGILIDFMQFDTLTTLHDFDKFQLLSANAHSEAFTVTPNGALRLNANFVLDYEDATMRQIEFVVHAMQITDNSSITEITITMQLADVDEPPVFYTDPKPYLATVRPSSSSGHTIIQLLAVDPEGAAVSYKKYSVQPPLYNNHIQLISLEGENGCELRTHGSGSFSAENGEIIVEVKAHDGSGLSHKTSIASVSILIGFRAPQFYQSIYNGFMLENNEVNQRVYKSGSNQELRVQYKTFQEGEVSLQVLDYDRRVSSNFGIDEDGYVLCKQQFDFENPPNQHSLIVRASQNAGNTVRTSAAQMAITIMDINDNPPVIQQSQYLSTVEENIDVGQTISELQVIAWDADSGDSGSVIFSVEGSDDFSILTTSQQLEGQLVYLGTLLVQRPLDYDRPEGPVYQFNVLAADSGSHQKSSSTLVRISVTNVNDEAPTFVIPNDNNAVSYVQEDAKARDVVINIRAIDRDGDGVSYGIDGVDPDNGLFSIDQISGQISITRDIRDNDNIFTIVLTAQDDGHCCSGEEIQRSQSTIRVQVNGINRHRPIFLNCIHYSNFPVFEYSHLEPTNVGSQVLTVSAMDQDRGPNGDVVYELVGNNGYFSIGSTSGALTVAGPIDRENVGDIIQVTVKATDLGQPPLVDLCTFRITVEDMNDNAPVFGNISYSFHLSTQAQINVPYFIISASDEDVGSNSHLTYSLVEDSDGLFGIIPDSGLIFLSQRLEPVQMNANFSIIAMATDGGRPPLSTTVLVLIDVAADETRPPSFVPPADGQDYNNQTYHVPETSTDNNPIISGIVCNSNLEDRLSTEILLVNAHGMGGTSNTFFYLSQNAGGSGVNVYSKNNFDMTRQREHNVRLRCLNFAEPVSFMIEVTPRVVLIDTNNQVPYFLNTDQNNRLSGYISEGQISDSILTVEYNDADTTPAFRDVTVQIVPFNGHPAGSRFRLDPVIGNPFAVTLANTVKFDRESAQDQWLKIEASDGAQSALDRFRNGPNKVSVNVKIIVSDVNDNDVHFTQQHYSITVPESYHIEQNIEPSIQITDLDQSDGGRHRFKVVRENGRFPSKFGVRPSSLRGYLFLLEKLDYESGTDLYVLEMEVDDYRSSATATVTVTVTDVNDNSPVFSQNTFLVDNITENDQTRRTILWLTASDLDVQRNTDHELRYSMQASSFQVNDFFEINSRTGQLFVINELDRDMPNGMAEYQITVRAADELRDPNYGYTTVSVRPRDVNDNHPQFVTDPLLGTVPESSAQGKSVMTVSVEDHDSGQNAHVGISISGIVDGRGQDRSHYFHIDDHGVIVTNTAPRNLDRETMDTYKLTVVLIDSGTPFLKTTGTVTVVLGDINDNAPQFAEKLVRVQVSERLQMNGEVARVNALDADLGDNAVVFYSLGTEDTNLFEIDPIVGVIAQQTIGARIRLFAENRLNYEDPSQRLYNLTVLAEDKDKLFDTCYVVIHVLDFNDNSPTITPSSVSVDVREDARIGHSLFTFTAADDDSGINAEFEFSISTSSNILKWFGIGPVSGTVLIRRHLDAEMFEVHYVHILCIDKGDPRLTGTATLTVTVENVNDNTPVFMEDYRPVIYEVANPRSGPGRHDVPVQVVLAKDADGPPFGAPYIFSLGDKCSSDCDWFSFQYAPAGGDGDGSAVITTRYEFDREAKKQFRLPILISDNSSNPADIILTGTSTLTITVGDINDNAMSDGLQDIFVYNYEGLFGPVAIGRVYVKDQDDWDLPDKKFTFIEPDKYRSYFSVSEQDGTVTMQKGVPSTQSGSPPFVFTVHVVDVSKTPQEKAVGTVSVTISDLTEEAVLTSGGVRIRGITAEEFILKSGSRYLAESAFDRFRSLLASSLATEESNVDIVSVQDVVSYAPSKVIDVRYAVRGSPYYPSSQSDGAVLVNKDKFEGIASGITVMEVPIDACSKEVFEGGCYNYINITGNPAAVNANGSSFVGVEVFVQPAAGCRAVTFPASDDCSADFCYHGGTCRKDDFGVLTCQNCPAGFDGSRCQQLSHSFDGKSSALYALLEQCEDSETSIEFITNQPDGLLLYNGPTAPQDFIALELRNGLPVLNINHGSGTLSLSIDGRNSRGDLILSRLDDGRWHKIDIVRLGRYVKIVVDDCRAAAESGSVGVQPDLAPCMLSGHTPGLNTFLNVATLLELGGRSFHSAYPSEIAESTANFDGCVRNLRHNSQLYDLYFKSPGGVVSPGSSGCQREGCSANSCHGNGVCSGSFLQPAGTVCFCHPGWSGATCQTRVATGHDYFVCPATSVRDWRASSFLWWTLNPGPHLPATALQVQMMYRTYDTDGVLFMVQAMTNQNVILELVDGRLQAVFSLGNKQRIVSLNSNSSNGQWHSVRLKRVMHHVTMEMDFGEGRNHASMLLDPLDEVYMPIDFDSFALSGAFVSELGQANLIDRDLSDTCVQDVRLNGELIPIESGQNTGNSIADHYREQNIFDGCIRPDSCAPLRTCPLNQICIDLWGHRLCRCVTGFYLTESGCLSTCLPDNPCFNNDTCTVVGGVVACGCSGNWHGQFCNLYRDESTVAVAGITITIIVVSILVILVLLLLAFLLVYRYRKRYDDSEKFVVADDTDYDIRENVMFYDDDGGAGEQDVNALELAILPVSTLDTMKPLSSAALFEERPDDTDRHLNVDKVLQQRLRDADGDPDAPPYDTLTAFDDEGGESDAGSLSSLGSAGSDDSQDFDYLDDCGQKFSKLADMYGSA